MQTTTKYHTLTGDGVENLRPLEKAVWKNSAEVEIPYGTFNTASGNHLFITLISVSERNFSDFSKKNLLCLLLN